jgi:phosphatidylglycerophosphatase C
MSTPLRDSCEYAAMLLRPGAHVAAFDFDGTLTHGDSLLPFLAGALGWPRFAIALLKCLPWLAGHALGLVRNDVAKARLFKAVWTGVPVATAQAWAVRWAEDTLPGLLQDWTLRRLAWHQAAGHYCVIVSASPSIYLQAAADRLGLDGLVCTELDIAGGRLTGAMRTPNCHGEQKVRRLQAWLADRFSPAEREGLTLYAYGDTAGDRPMLGMAHHGWYRGRYEAKAPAANLAAAPAAAVESMDPFHR